MEWFSYTANQTSVLLVMILGDIYFVITAVHVVHLHLGGFFFRSPSFLYVLFCAARLMFLNAVLGIGMVSQGLIINTRYGGHGDPMSAGDKSLTKDAENGFEDDFNDVEIMSQNEEDDDDASEEDVVKCRECDHFWTDPSLEQCPECKTWISPEKEVEMIENQYVQQT
jgi:hypothetical protein